MKITVIGAGYVGLVSGCCFAEMGNSVVCVDNDEKKLEKLRRRKLPIYEPHLEDIFRRNLDEKRILFTNDMEKGLRHGDFVFFSLPTPPSEDGSADLSYILQVAEKAGKIIQSKNIEKYKIFINKSTVPVGTAEKVKNILESYTSNFNVVSNPEFLKEGFAVTDFLKPDRIIIGTTSPKAENLMRILYKPFTRQGNPLYVMDERSAELTKYVANSYLATRITFMNEIANLCEKLKTNVDHVRLGIGSDTRIGKRFLFPGIGYGGSCFPKDVEALTKMAHNAHSSLNILTAVQKTNVAQKKVIVNKISEYFGKIKGKTFSVWGLTFKPGTDDVRKTSAKIVIETLVGMGAKIKAYDPEGIENFRQICSVSVEYFDNNYECLKDADALLILTEWSNFRNVDFEKIRHMMKKLVIFDGRNIFDIQDIKSIPSLYYNSIGRETIQT